MRRIVLWASELALFYLLCWVLVRPVWNGPITSIALLGSIFLVSIGGALLRALFDWLREMQ
jgi:hypothetical protein